MNEVFKFIQSGIWAISATVAILLALCQLFPSMRGQQWNGEEWQAAIIFALVAIALK